MAHDVLFAVLEPCQAPNSDRTFCFDMLSCLVSRGNQPVYSVLIVAKRLVTHENQIGTKLRMLHRLECANRSCHLEKEKSLEKFSSVTSPPCLRFGQSQLIFQVLQCHLCTKGGIQNSRGWRKNIDRAVWTIAPHVQTHRLKHCKASKGADEASKVLRT